MGGEETRDSSVSDPAMPGATIRQTPRARARVLDVADLPELPAGCGVGPDVARAGGGHVATSSCGGGVTVAALALSALRVFPLLLGLDRQH